MAEALVPEGEVYRNGGRGGEIGCLWDRDGGALEIGNGGGVHLSLKHGLATKSEGQDIPS